jgi:transcriptional regulator with GAF, ATPase, and Fis domain
MSTAAMSPASSATRGGPIFDDPKRLLLDMARQRSLDELLRLIVDRLASSSRVALARVWLARPGDLCATCGMRWECPDQSSCLHLVASAGRSAVEPGEDWSRLDGGFRRIPLGVRKVGQIGRTGEPIELPDLGGELGWVVRPDWVRREGIVGFGGQPLVHQGRVLGVLGVFTRSRIGEGCFDWLRVIADHAAASITNARAFEEIDTLRGRLEQENAYLQEEVREAHAFGDIVGRSRELSGVLLQVARVAPTSVTVLILGESGTGKELVAREIHRRSGRSAHPLIKVNCAAVPRELYESEFFGHVRGAFTGALRDRAGRFELADGGTLFLDEVGEIPLELQGKLLRVLQEGELERVGEERTRRVDVRVIAATNRELRREVEAGRFRQDLYYRLNVFPVVVAPLRKRPEDVPVLAKHFLEQSAQRMGRPTPWLTVADVERLQLYDWPGNVRELQHVLERAVITAAGGRLRVELPAEPGASGDGPAGGLPLPAREPGRILTDAEIRQLERENIRAALEAARGKVYGPGGAAERLGLKPTTLASRMKALGLERPKGGPGA